LSGGWQALIAPLISMGDCWSPPEQGANHSRWCRNSTATVLGVVDESAQSGLV
jgi:hypothetical protein